MQYMTSPSARPVHAPFFAPSCQAKATQEAAPAPSPSAASPAVTPTPAPASVSPSAGADAPAAVAAAAAGEAKAARAAAAEAKAALQAAVAAVRQTAGQPAPEQPGAEAAQLVALERAIEAAAACGVDTAKARKLLCRRQECATLLAALHTALRGAELAAAAAALKALRAAGGNAGGRAVRQLDALKRNAAAEERMGQLLAKGPSLPPFPLFACLSANLPWSMSPSHFFCLLAPSALPRFPALVPSPPQARARSSSTCARPSQARRRPRQSWRRAASPKVGPLSRLSSPWLVYAPTPFAPPPSVTPLPSLVPPPLLHSQLQRASSMR